MELMQMAQLHLPLDMIMLNKRGTLDFAIWAMSRRMRGLIVHIANTMDIQLTSAIRSMDIHWVTKSNQRTISKITLFLILLISFQLTWINNVVLRISYRTWTPTNINNWWWCCPVTWLGARTMFKWIRIEIPLHMLHVYVILFQLAFFFLQLKKFW